MTSANIHVLKPEGLSIESARSLVIKAITDDLRRKKMRELEPRDRTTKPDRSIAVGSVGRWVCIFDDAAVHHEPDALERFASLASSTLGSYAVTVFADEDGALVMSLFHDGERVDIARAAPGATIEAQPDRWKPLFAKKGATAFRATWSDQKSSAAQRIRKTAEALGLPATVSSAHSSIDDRALDARHDLRFESRAKRAAPREVKASRESGLLLLPTCFWGGHGEVNRACKREGQRWAREYAKTGRFPDPAYEGVPTGTVILLDHNQSHRWDSHPQWRLAHLLSFFTFVMHSLEYDNEAERRATYDQLVAHLDASPWGAIQQMGTWGIGRLDPRIVARRTRCVLHHWDVLDRYRYVTNTALAVSLTQALSLRHDALCRTWCDEPTGDLRKDLAVAVDRLEKANKAEIVRRLIPAIRRVADEMREFRSSPELRDDAWVEAKLRALPKADLDHVSSGMVSPLLGELYQWKR